eukprot:SAG25_NODE_1455_length_2987_cov_23.382964_2_plen_49_part_00
MFVSSWPLSQQRGLSDSCLDLSIQEQQQNPDSPIATHRAQRTSPGDSQ